MVKYHLGSGILSLGIAPGSVDIFKSSCHFNLSQCFQVSLQHGHLDSAYVLHVCMPDAIC